MVRRNDEPKTRKHIWMYDRDIERLESMYAPNLTLSDAVRAIVRAHLNAIEAKALASAKAPKVEEPSP